MNALYGPGLATYWKDADVVYLDWQPRGGRVQHLAGPLPASAIEGTPAYLARRHIIRGVVVALGGGLTFLIVQVALHVWRIVHGLRRHESPESAAQPTPPARDDPV